MQNNSSNTYLYDVVIVGGLGHVGLPLGLLLAKQQFNVALWDINETYKQQVKSGVMPFVEYGAAEVLSEVLGRTLHVAESMSVISEAEVVIVTVGTPLDDDNQPSMVPIIQLVDQMLGLLSDDQLLMLRSTVFPGTTEKVSELCRQGGRDLDVAFCPERILQGYALQEFNTLAQIVSGNSHRAVERSRAIFESLGIRSVMVAPLEAELAKLFTNAWRYLQFAIANQFYSIAVENSVDFDKIYNAITYGYDRARDMPRPGFAAGPCLYKDTMQLAAFCGEQFPMGQQAARINQGMPEIIIKQLERAGIDTSSSAIGILGMAFKAEIDDLRDSLSVRLKQLLEERGATVLCADEFADEPDYLDPEEIIKKVDAVVLGAPHRAYKSLNIRPGLVVIDPWALFCSGRK